MPQTRSLLPDVVSKRTNPSVSTHLKLALRRVGTPLYSSLLARNPRIVFWLTGHVGRWTEWWSSNSHCVSDREVGRLFGHVAPDRRTTIAREIRSVGLKNRALMSLLELDNGFEIVLPLLRWHGEDRLRALHKQGRPAILLLWHAGASYPAIVPGLFKLAIPTLLVARKPEGIRMPPGLELCEPPRASSRGGPLGATGPRVAVLQRAVRYARSGGLVALAPDAPRFGDGVVETSCFGRRIKLLKGFAAIARAAAADVIPVVASWEQGGSTIAVRAYEPLPRPDISEHSPVAFDEAFVDTAAKWIESYLYSAPGDIGLDLRDQLHEAPLITQPPSGGSQ